jgi:hypothetical protein
MRRTLGLTLVLLLSSVGPVSAHHSGAMFDRAKMVTLQGVVKEYQFTNPHAWIEVMVTDKGKTTQWGVEAEGPRLMRRLGLVPSTLKPGDKVTVRAHPLRDGRPGGSFVDIVLANGKTITAQRLFPQSARPPAS